MTAAQRSSVSVPERIVIVGSSCAGKTTFAARVGSGLGLQHTQLDELHWLPDWVARDPDDFLARVIDAAAEERWVMDGNYQKVRPHLWSRATTIIWLNYSFPRVLWRCLKRSVWRSLTGETLYAGNVESFRRTFLSKDSILLWVMTNFGEKRRRYETLLSSELTNHCTVIECRRPADAEQWLKQQTLNDVLPAS
ncbi:hypothetical protein [Reinekea blandensis]|uniref:Adenylate kinase n=1 Tax=Reinekea blandensis MED297 TaxID=314283 RepID=A4BCR3_9GAMM|nr:hypothetical protein [Reinekea blandensis]EAR09995.1 hypothetical protein MED297_07901 [Reinekea sp. MED297] [Reinekea blandensis MED297]